MTARTRLLLSPPRLFGPLSLFCLFGLLCLVGALLTATPAVAEVDPAPTDGRWPLEPRPQVVSVFDPPDARWGAGHRGVDLAGHLGQPVHAALAGRVSFAGRLAGRGVVVVDHGATRTTYEPVTATVSVGDRVAEGAILGRLDLFGSHCFPHLCLHWGLIEGREHYLDPLTLVGGAPVRLLPLSRSATFGERRLVPLRTFSRFDAEASVFPPS